MQFCNLPAPRASGFYRVDTVEAVFPGEFPRYFAGRIAFKLK
jgi:hypothetical protein